MDRITKISTRRALFYAEITVSIHWVSVVSLLTIGWSVEVYSSSFLDIISFRSKIIVKFEHQTENSVIQFSNRAKIPELV